MDKFERYIPYVGKKVTDKEKLLEAFAAFLEHPEYFNEGCFVVRWVENDDWCNRVSIDQFIEDCK